MRGDKELAEFVPDIREQRDNLLARCAEVAANYNTTLQCCALMNVYKLRRRFNQGCVLGDGSTR